MVVFINKADLVDDEMLDLVQLEMIELLSAFGYDGENTPMIKGSALLALRGDQSKYGEPSIHQLVKALDHHIPLPQRDNQSPFLMPIDNFISVPGRGTVVIGTIKRGCLKKGAAMEVLGFGANIKTSVTGIQVFKQEQQEALAGDNVGINVKQVKPNQLKKGMLLTAKGSCKPTNHFDVGFLILGVTCPPLIVYALFREWCIFLPKLKEVDRNPF